MKVYINVERQQTKSDVATEIWIYDITLYCEIWTIDKRMYLGYGEHSRFASTSPPISMEFSQLNAEKSSKMYVTYGTQTVCSEWWNGISRVYNGTYR